MDWYINLVQQHPIITAMVQFALLGTLGDMISKWIINKRVFLPFSFFELIQKFIEWAILAVLIKYAFIGFQGFVDSLSSHNLLPELTGFWRAFAVSLTMNLQFGILLVLLHRLLDNYIHKVNNWENINKGLYSLIWFWIPAHTVTFTLPKEFQIGLAALWSVVLGAILGFYGSKKTNISK